MVEQTAAIGKGGHGPVSRGTEHTEGVKVMRWQWRNYLSCRTTESRVSRARVGRHLGGMIQRVSWRGARNLEGKGSGRVWDIPGRIMGNMSFGTLQGWQESSGKTVMMSAVIDPED